MNDIQNPQPIPIPSDLSTESKCLLICLLTNFGILHTRKIGFPLAPYSNQVKSMLDDYPAQIGISRSTFQSTMTRLEYKIDQRNENVFLPSVAKLLSENLKSHQVAYCKYIIQKFAWLIWQAGSKMNGNEIDNGVKNIFAYL